MVVRPRSIVWKGKLMSKTIVVKVGSSNLVDLEGRLDLLSLTRLVVELKALHTAGYRLVLVTSGAVAAGAQKVIVAADFCHHRKQLLAAVGQGFLMQKYTSLFGEYGITVGQILLVREDLDNRRLYLNARETLLGLLAHSVIPIVNENDVVTAGSFGGNDLLAAAVAGLVDAEQLVILSNIDGVFAHFPATAGERPLAQIAYTDLAGLLLSFATNKTSALGTGGIQTKLEAARMAAEFGVETVICNGATSGVLKLVVDGVPVGTRILAQSSKLEARKRWLLFGVKAKGMIKVDEGALQALVERGSSLLAVGIKAVTGKFGRGDAVTICDPDGAEKAVGLIRFTDREIEQIRGKRSAEIKVILGESQADEVVHRDDLVLL